MTETRDGLTQVLAQLAGSGGPETVVALDALLREQPERAGRAVDGLLPLLARVRTPADTARVEVALATAYLARGEARQARELLLDALAQTGIDPRLHARAVLKLAAAEAAQDGAKAARAHLLRSLGPVLALDDLALDDLSRLLRGANEPLAAGAVDELRRARRAAPTGDAARTGARLDVLGRLLRALGTSLQATSEPLHAVLRAVLDETGGHRGFLMLYEGDTLRFELGLGREGRVLGEEDFRFSTTVVARTLEEGRCVLVPDLSAVLRFAAATSAQELGIRSALCAPLLVGRKRPGAPPDPAPLAAVRGIAGVLYVDSPTAASFRESDGTFFETLADCAAVAVRAARTTAALRGYQRAEGEERERTVRSKRRAAQTSVEPEVALEHPYEGIVTRDEGVRRVLKLLDRVVASDANVLVRGESGTGKELVARAIHRHGRNPSGPFVAVDCGAVPDELVASELFGHEAGAFTGATEARPGLFERASGGTLFLDEVGEMSPAMQGALLRVLQEGEVRRLGAARARPVNVRLVTATHRDLRTLVEEGRFRHDLFFRLAVVEVKLPPLRDRAGDVPLLARHLLQQIAARGGAPILLEPDALARLEEHGWPGNVRELENVLEALALEADGAITLGAVDRALAASPRAPLKPATAKAGNEPASGAGLEGTLEDLERRAIEERLERFGWNQVQAAESLGIDRRTLYRKIRRFGLGKG